MSERIEKLKNFLKQSPNDCFLNHALALELIKSGDDNEARKYFEHNIAVDPHYIPTYYHFGKLLERNGDHESAIKLYETGMKEAKTANDMHTYNELQGAYEDLVY